MRGAEYLLDALPAPGSFQFYVLSALLVVIGASSLYQVLRPRIRYRVKKSRKLHVQIQSMENDARLFGYLRKVDPFLFEELILTAYESKGFTIKRNKRYTGDGGIDGQVKIDDKWHYIQAKRYSSAINPKHVQDFSTLCRDRKRPGVFIHTGRTGPKSSSIFSACERVSVISGSKLIQLLKSDLH